jgi:hypothetical protein
MAARKINKKKNVMNAVGNAFRRTLGAAGGGAVAGFALSKSPIGPEISSAIVVFGANVAAEMAANPIVSDAASGAIGVAADSLMRSFMPGMYGGTVAGIGNSDAGYIEDPGVNEYGVNGHDDEGVGNSGDDDEDDEDDEQ